MELLQRLRDPFKVTPQDAAEAADEIERLREEHHDVRILNEQYFNENAILIDEIERLREKYEKLLGASVAFQIAIQNALFVFERTVDDIHQKESE